MTARARSLSAFAAGALLTPLLTLTASPALAAGEDTPPPPRSVSDFCANVPAGYDPFTDDNGNTFEQNIDVLLEGVAVVVGERVVARRHVRAEVGDRPRRRGRVLTRGERWGGGEGEQRRQQRPCSERGEAPRACCHVRGLLRRGATLRQRCGSVRRDRNAPQCHVLGSGAGQARVDPATFSTWQTCEAFVQVRLFS